MGYGAVCGWTEAEVEQARIDYQDTPLYETHNIPFETAHCLSHIGKQPEDYDGPPRFCSNRASKLTEKEYLELYPEAGEYFPRDTRAYASTCRFHGRKHPGNTPQENLEDPRTVSITHGLTAEDEHLRMDFTDAEQALHDSILEEWPDIYDWPGRDEDPARYLILEKVAVNVVRSVRAEDYIDDEGEVRITDRFSSEGVLIEEDGQHDENPIAGEYRLLWREITQNLKELGLTPKERAKQGAMEQTGEALSNISELASKALDSDAAEYDPNRFDDSDDSDST